MIIVVVACDDAPMNNWKIRTRCENSIWGFMWGGLVLKCGIWYDILKVVKCLNIYYANTPIYQRSNLENIFSSHQLKVSQWGILQSWGLLGQSPNLRQITTFGGAYNYSDIILSDIIKVILSKCEDLTTGTFVNIDPHYLYVHGSSFPNGL